MNLVKMIGAGALVMVGGGLLAWTFDDRSVEATVAKTGDSVVAMDGADTEMARSQAAARTTFDAFWTRINADKTGLDAISIKVAVPHAGGAEHLWMTGCKSANAQTFDCVVSNEAVDVPLKLGSRYSFERASISDWMYRQNGKIHGGYSIRALLPTLPAQQAQAMTAMLAPLPQ